MGARSSYPHGTPCWVDLGSPVADAAQRFYGDLFGWECEIDPRPEAGGYGLFRLRDATVAGLGPQMDKSQPPYWTTYVAVDDVAAALSAALVAGGSVMMPATEVLTAGTMGIIGDPAGIPISVWQAGDHPGCGLVNEPGTFVWNELATTSLPAAKAFYGEVFGWTAESADDGDGAVIFQVDGRVTCGAHVAGDGEQPFWTVWFAVDDCDAAAEEVLELGGTIYMDPTDMSFGRGAVAADAQGAVFGIGSMTDADD